MGRSSGWPPSGAARSWTPCSRSPIARGRSKCAASRNAPRRRGRRAARATCSCAVARSFFGAAPGARRPEPRAPSLLQVFDTYILFQTAQGIAIVDQHSAHERVLYETVMRQLTGDGAPAQRLLLPLTLQFAPPELDAIDSHRELLGRVGYEIEPFSGRAVVVHTAPNPHPRFDAARCLQELVADLAGGASGGGGPAKPRQRLAAA